MTTPNPYEEEVEQLSVQIHQLYCEQYEKDHKEPYWTKGDYSKLEERVKEYDRNIARFHLKALHTSSLSLIQRLRERVPSDETDIMGFGYLGIGDEARNQERARLRLALQEEEDLITKQ